jgi:periplasmic protein TonB
MPRTLLNLGDIAAVPQRSPRRIRKRTPWRPQPDGTVTVRAGERDWFSDRLFVESRDRHARSGYGASVVVHLLVAAALVAFLLTRPIHSIVVRMQSLAMPAFSSEPPTPPAADIPVLQKAAPRSPKVETAAPAAAAPPALGTSIPAAAPLEPPLEITPETGAEAQRAGDESGVAGGIAGGLAGGVPGGVAGGVVGGLGSAHTGQAGSIVVRAGTGMKPPRKIRDVKPVYPAGALPLRAQGAVLIEAVIGPDGRVQDAKVLHSVGPFLDQAALDAVRQWAYEPTLLNGDPVTVVMTVVVNFALQ